MGGTQIRWGVVPMLRKTLVALASAIVAISGVALAAPATALSPGLHHEGGGKPPPYPASVITQTRVDMEPSTVKVGRCAWANITVRSAVGRPTGSVELQVGGNSYSATLSNGRARLCISNLPVGTYIVVASYSPTGGSIWKPSGDTDFLRVVRNTPGNCHQDKRYSRL